MKVEALNCPNCGAGVQSDSTLCQFCKTRLKTVACSSCFGLMFVGNGFCGHCGAMAAPVETLGNNKDAGECPRCRIDLDVLCVSETIIRGCSKCDGLWMDVATFENICAEREKQSAVLGFIQKKTTDPKLLTKISYVPCPDCSQLMNRNNFAKASGVIVDICKQHGVWFDADELPAVVKFIRKGGLEFAREREKVEIFEQRVRLREEQGKPVDFNQSFGGQSTWDGDDSEGIRGFVQKLFE